MPTLLKEMPIRYEILSRRDQVTFFRQMTNCRIGVGVSEHVPCKGRYLQSHIKDTHSSPPVDRGVKHRALQVRVLALIQRDSSRERRGTGMLQRERKRSVRVHYTKLQVSGIALMERSVVGANSETCRASHAGLRVIPRCAG